MTRRIALWVLLVLSSIQALGQEQRWEIEPKADDRIKVGKLSVVGGQTAEEGVRFVINHLDIMQPIEISLAAEDAGQKLTLLVYKEVPEQPLLERTTNGEATAVAQFRTQDSIQLMVKGPSGAKYQLMTWVGPAVEMPTPDALVPIDKSGMPLVEGVALTPPAQTGSSSEAQTGGGTTKLEVPPVVTALLALILAAVVVLIIVVVRRGGKGKATPAVLVAALALGEAQSVGRAQAGNPMLTPKNVTVEDVRRELNKDLQKLREQLEALDKAGVKTDPEVIKILRPGSTPFNGPAIPGTPFDKKKAVGSYVTSMKLLLAFMEEFGLIDPREAAVQPNYNPPGQPLIPSRCAGPDDCGACFADANAKLTKSRKLLEDMYVIYKQTELQAGRIHEMANAAAGLSPYGQLVWTAIKNNPKEPMNVAQKKFYDTYDTNLGKLLTMANEGLIGVGACEREHYKDYDWYPRYGMVYYNFLKDRYTRK